MANGLEVSASGLRAASADSEALAAGLLLGETANARLIGNDDPSAAGVSSVNAAMNLMRERQAQRVARQADDLSASGGRYDDTDGNGADAISVTV